MPRLWSQSYVDTVRIARLYLNAGQYTDAAIVFVWAAEVAPSEADETATLSDAFVCLVLAGQWEDEA